MGLPGRLASLLIALSAIACSSDKSGGGALPGGGGTGKAEVTYQPNARVLEEDEGLAAVLGQSSDGWTLVLDAKSPRVQGLKAGDVLVIKNQIARQVLAVEPQPEGMAVLTQSASLGEVLQQGKVEFKAGVRFTAEGAYLEPLGRPRRTRHTLLERTSELLEGTAHAGKTMADKAIDKAKKVEKMIKSPSKIVYEGWEATFHATPEAGRVNLDIQITKSLGGFKALITAKGYVQDFDVESVFSVNSGVIDMELINKNVNGRMDFTWEVGKESPGVETGKARIKLPGAISIPLGVYLGGLPLFLEISAAALIQPAFTGGKEHSKGAFHITYDGGQGFRIAKGATTADEGTMHGDTGIDSLAAVSPAAPVGMVVSFAAPRLELSLGLAKVFKPETMKLAADRVDKIADYLIQKTFGDDGLARWKASPMGGFSLGKAIEKALASDASAYFEFEISTGMTQAGAMAVVPCRQSSIHLAAVVGAGAQFLGVKVAAPEPKTVFKKDYEKVEPPNLKACQ
jgi:hypothetical protein